MMSGGVQREKALLLLRLSPGIGHAAGLRSRFALRLGVDHAAEKIDVCEQVKPDHQRQDGAGQTECRGEKSLAICWT